MENARSDRYEKYRIRRVLSIDQIATIHYLSGIHDFATPDDSHDFWEIVYVDYGAVELVSGDAVVPLRAKQFYLLEPNRPHIYRAGNEPAAVFILSFVCPDQCLWAIKGRPLAIGSQAEKLLPLLIDEILGAFVVDDDQQIILRNLNPRDATPFGAEQMICLYLEQLLISLLRHETPLSGAKAPLPQADNPIVQQVLDYIQAHLGEALSVPLLAAQVNYSRTYLSDQFQNSVGMGMMEYIERERIRRAKLLLAQNKLSVTSIASLLGFSSVHYFSRRFRMRTGCSPMRYAASLQSKLENIAREEMNNCPEQATKV